MFSDFAEVDKARQRRTPYADLIVHTKAGLLVVTGAPATGKTTLASTLGSELQLPVLSKDMVKDALLESLGATSLHESQQLGQAAFSVLFALAKELLEARVSLILEAPFASGVSEPDLRTLTDRAVAAVIVCTAPPDLVRDRFRQRAAGPQRHPGHMDKVRPEMSRTAAFEPPRLGVPQLVVNTSNGYEPSIREAIEWISLSLVRPKPI